jgi:hypothetical protein
MIAQPNWRPFKIIQFLIVFAISFMAIAQNTNSRWNDHFSYSSIRHIWEINGLLFCSAENGLFTYDLQSGEIHKISKVNELNDVGISAFGYSRELDLMLIGYDRGEMDIIGEEETTNLLEIPLHQSYTGSKIVNHIYPEGNAAIISGEFGIATFSLENHEFMETTYFNSGGYSFGVKESTVLDGIIYSASDAGVFIHALNEFTADFSSWERQFDIPNSPFQNIVNFQGNIFTSTWDRVYRFDGQNWTLFGTYPALMDITVNGNVMSLVSLNNVVNLNENLTVIDSVPFNLNIRTALKVGNTTYGGSLFDGLLNGTQSIMPDGPYNNKSWKITTFKGSVWIAPGGMVNYNHPQHNLDGYSYFNGTIWEHIPSENIYSAKDIVDVEVNPNKPEEVYVSPWFEYTQWPANPANRIGLIRVENNIAQQNIIDTNTDPAGFWRVGGSTFDEDGNLWVGQSFVSTQSKTVIMKKSPTGAWQAMDLNASSSGAGAKKPVIFQGYAYMALPRQGGVKITNMENTYSINSTSNAGALPSNDAYAVAVDQNGVLWIGTDLGLRVLYSPIETMQQGPFQTQPIIIEQDGIPEALFTDVQINDIEVDESNQKWVATQTSGAYYVSEDGTNTIYHFTTSNSPLPSNSIYDIEVDGTTGVVYFATEKGVVSFQSDALEVGDSFGDVYAYPNPVRPGFTGNVVIRGLPNDADVRIVDVVGNLIFKTKSSGGTAIWDTKNMKGKPVASGIYLVLMTNKDASKNKQTKIAIIR